MTRFLSVLFILICATGFRPSPPEAKISNGIVTAHFYLPDANNGYYRGSRFDWSGVIYDLSYKNHHYFGKWFEKYEPTIHDAIMGPVDAFDPIGYEEAKAGESFLKIGVGWVEKIQDEKYSFGKYYKLVDGGKWTTKKSSDKVVFTHDMKTGTHPYQYTKTVSLTAGQPELIIHHKLKNNGKSSIETNVFNHNFFVIDDQQIGPGFEVTLPFPPEGERKGKAEAARPEGNKIIYEEPINKGEYFSFSPLAGYGPSADDNQFTIDNTKSGASVSVQTDKPIVRYIYWSSYATLCPEPYIAVRVDPGQEFEWTSRYTFSGR